MDSIAKTTLQKLKQTTKTINKYILITLALEKFWNEKEAKLRRAAQKRIAGIYCITPYLRPEQFGTKKISSKGISLYEEK